VEKAPERGCAPGDDKACSSRFTEWHQDELSREALGQNGNHGIDYDSTQAEHFE